MTRVGIVGYRIPPLRIGSYLFSLFVLIYKHTLNADWPPDDDNYILQNRNIKIGSLGPDSLGNAVYVPFPGDPRLSRPFPMLSSALKGYAHNANPMGCHTANITHFMIMRLLCLTIAVLLQKTPRLQSEYSGQDRRSLFWRRYAWRSTLFSPGPSPISFSAWQQWRPSSICCPSICTFRDASGRTSGAAMRGDWGAQ